MIRYKEKYLRLSEDNPGKLPALICLLLCCFVLMIRVGKPSKTFWGGGWRGGSQLLPLAELQHQLRRPRRSRNIMLEREINGGVAVTDLQRGGAGAAAPPPTTKQKSNFGAFWVSRTPRVRPRTAQRGGRGHPSPRARSAPRPRAPRAVPGPLAPPLDGGAHRPRVPPRRAPAREAPGRRRAPPSPLRARGGQPAGATRSEPPPALATLIPQLPGKQKTPRRAERRRGERSAGPAAAPHPRNRLRAPRPARSAPSARPLRGAERRCAPAGPAPRRRLSQWRARQPPGAALPLAERSRAEIAAQGIYSRAAARAAEPRWRPAGHPGPSATHGPALPPTATPLAPVLSLLQLAKVSLLALFFLFLLRRVG